MRAIRILALAMWVVGSGCLQPTSEDGREGRVGSTGSAGEKGEKGDKGDQGEKGEPGGSGSYCGLTSFETQGRFKFGSLSGWRAAKAACEEVCGSQAAYMCTSFEMVHAFQKNLLPPDTAGWIAGLEGDANCDGWTENSSSGWYGNGGDGFVAACYGSTSDQRCGLDAAWCDDHYPILCCK